MNARERELRAWLAAHQNRWTTPAPKPTKTPTTPPVTPPAGSGGSTGTGGTTTPTTPVTSGKWTQTVNLTFPTAAARGKALGPAGVYPALGYYDGADYKDTSKKGTYNTIANTEVVDGWLKLHLKGTSVAAVAPFGFTGHLDYKIDMVFRNQIVTAPRAGYSGHHHVPLTWPDGDDWTRGEADPSESDYIAGATPVAYLHATDGNPSRNAGVHSWAATIFDGQTHTLSLEYDHLQGFTIYLDGAQWGYSGADARPVNLLHFVDQHETSPSELPTDPLAEVIHSVQSYTLWRLT